jgi:flagellar hook-length control protein FliK
MNFSPIAVTYSTAMTDSASGSSLSASEDGSQASEFTSLLSDSLAQHGAPSDGQQSGPELTAQQQLQIALQSAGQDLPLAGESLPPGKLMDADMDLTAELPLATDPAETPALMAGSMMTAIDDQQTLLANISVAASVSTALADADASAGDAMAIVEETPAGTQLPAPVSGTPVSIPLQGAAVVEQESAIAAQALNQKNPGSLFNNQPVTQMQQTNIPMQSGTGEQALNGQSEASSLPVLTDARVATTEAGPDFSRIIEKGLAQLNREMVSSTQVPLSDPASRTSLDGMKLSSESLLLQQPIDKPKWGQEFGSRMVWMSKEGIQNAQIRLTPAHLGTIEVKISIQNDQANISFMSQHGAVREAIEATLPRLREMMQEAGVKLEQANVSGGESNTDTQQKHADKTPAQLAQANQPAQGDDEDIAGATVMPVAHEGMLSAVDYYA